MATPLLSCLVTESSVRYTLTLVRTATDRVAPGARAGTSMTPTSLLRNVVDIYHDVILTMRCKKLTATTLLHAKRFTEGRESKHLEPFRVR